MAHVIEATIIGGEYAGNKEYIPRIPLLSTNLPFTFKRLQFPVRLSYAMTINKAQGQTLSTVGINLSNDCFGHGQLYVACSRVGDDQKLFYHSPRENVTNIVYKEALKNW